jgi:RimJ/RimL family protein N-acetyltransferase
MTETFVAEEPDLRGPAQDPRPLTRDAPPFEPGPVVLEGRLVRLEPLTEAHLPGLEDVAYDPEIWRWTLGVVMDAAALRRYVDQALAGAAAGSEVPFVQVDPATGREIGMTRFTAIERAHRRLEIGYTWLAAPSRGRGTNTEAKLLMLTQALDGWGANRVEFKTDANNVRSRAALRAIGATEEGTLRRHLVTDAGRVRDSVYFSITWDEWPAVRARLEDRLSRATDVR